MYNLERRKVKNFLKQNNFDRVAIQLPEGLREDIDKVESVYREENVDPIFLGTSCYGSCDLADEQAKSLGCDALIHYGHSDMGISSSIPTLYIEARMQIEPFDALEKSLSELKGSKWGLITTVQHIQHLDEVRDFLKDREIKVVIGTSGPRCKYDGQILGCDWTSATSICDEVDGFLYIGTGDFHPQGVSLATGRPVVAINPIVDDCYRIEVDRNEFFKKRAAQIEKARSGEEIGIVVSVKPGQKRLDLAINLSKKLRRKRYSPHILVMDEISPSVLADYRLDALINTACPRISFDDIDSYESPVLTPLEVQILLEEREWENYELDEIGKNFEE